MQEISKAAIYERLGSMDAKMDQLLDGADDKERRIRKLEVWRNWAAGGVACLSAVGAVLLTQAGHISAFLDYLRTDT